MATLDPWQQLFDMESANFDLSYSRGCGRDGVSYQCIVTVGVALYRMVYEWRDEVSIPIGHFDGTFPRIELAALPLGTKIVPMASRATPEFVPVDAGGSVPDHRYLQSYRDSHTMDAVSHDAGVVAPHSDVFPTLRKWAESMNGVVVEAVL